MKQQYLAATLSAVAAVGMLVAPSITLAASKSQNMPVQAQVNANCNFTSSNTMDFLTYDPTGANAAAPLGGSVVVSVRCTRGASVSIGIDTGANAGQVAGSTRAMKNGANYLGYDFYQDAAYATLWTNAAPGLYSFVSASNNPFPVTVYGRVPANQDVPAGLYQDTVVVTVNY
jgi:spore coat protein U-like protein